MKENLRFGFILQSLVALFAASVVVSCDNIDDSNLGLGTDETVKEVTIAEVSLDLNTVGISSASSVVSRADSSTTMSFTEMFDILEDINKLMPTNLTGVYADGIDITMLKDSDYTTGLVDILFDEIKNNKDKRLEFSEMAIDRFASGSYDYLFQLNSTVSVDLATCSVEELAESLDEVLNSTADVDIYNVSSTKKEIVEYITQVTADLESDCVVEEELNESINVDENIMDFISGNIDDDNIFLYLLSLTSTNLPMDVKVSISIKLSNGTTIPIYDYDSSTDSTSHYKISSEELEMILDNMTIIAEMNINNYDPATFDLEGKFLKVKFIMRKIGGYTF